MPDQDPSKMFRPFKNLNNLMEAQRTCIEKETASPAEKEPRPKKSLTDDELFIQAMSGVEKIDGVRRVEKQPAPPASAEPKVCPDDDAYHQLQTLVDTGKGFRVSQTSEYIAGTGAGVHPSVVSRLHKGDFSIQDFIDLHGLGLTEAEAQFHAFLKYAITRRRKAVLIVHGRGLRSTSEPVLKSNVVKWINSRTWRKWIVAYASARLCDGGAGATYILLRDTPRSKASRIAGF